MWINKIFKKYAALPFFRWWFMISATYSASSVCPCCGKSACPAGLNIVALIGFLFVSFWSVGRNIWWELRKAVHS